MANSLDIKINDREIQRALREFPKITSSSMNRAKKRVAKAYGKELAQGPFAAVGGVFRSVRNVKMKKVPPGQPSFSVVARRAGVKAVLQGEVELHGKALSIRTSSPLLVIRELGGVIRPKSNRAYTKNGKKYLLVKYPKRRGQPRRNSAGKYDNVAEFYSVDEPIVVPPVLGMVRRWRKNENSYVELLEGGVEDAVRRITLQLEKEVARRRG